jgi:hypothetical protein
MGNGDRGDREFGAMGRDVPAERLYDGVGIFYSSGEFMAWRMACWLMLL